MRDVREVISKTTLPGAPRPLLLPLVGARGAGPVEEDGEPVAGLPPECLSDGEVWSHQVRHADEEDVVGGVVGRAVDPGVGVVAAVQEAAGQQAVESVLVESSHLTQQRHLGDVALSWRPEAAKQAPHHVLLHWAETTILESVQDLRDKILISSK